MYYLRYVTYTRSGVLFTLHAVGGGPTAEGTVTTLRDGTWTACNDAGGPIHVTDPAHRFIGEAVRSWFG